VAAPFFITYWLMASQKVIIAPMDGRGWLFYDFIIELLLTGPKSLGYCYSVPHGKTNP